MLIDLGDTHSHVERKPERLSHTDAPSQVGGNDETAFARRHTATVAYRKCILAPPDIRQHQCWNGGSLVHFKSRNRVTEKASGARLTVANASNRISVNLRGNSGATSPDLRGPQSSGVFCPARFSNGTDELLKNGIFLHLKALSAPGQGDEATQRRYHFGAEP